MDDSETLKRQFSHTLAQTALEFGQHWALTPLTTKIGLPIIALSVGVLAYGILTIIYNIHLHPLAAYPGPLLARSSLLWRIFHSTSGRFHLAVDAQHKKHGPVVRVGPNELSFASVASWKAIYGHKPTTDQTLIKSEFYEMYGSGFKSLCIGSERDPTKHRQMKSHLSAAFSTKALLEQETLVQTTVDGFVAKLGRDGGPQSSGLNMTKWYEMIAFDVLGEMAFGESFHCIEDGHPHFWQELILDHLFYITVADNLRRLPFVPFFARMIFPLTEGIRNKHTGFTRAKVESRLASQSGRKDFLTSIVTKVEKGEVPKEEVTAHTSTLIIAGRETVATFLAAVTYHLLKGSNPAYQKLLDEIRGRYRSYEDIDGVTTQQLPYLQAVIHEGLRIYPPGSIGFPRLSANSIIDGRVVPKGTEVYTSAWTLTHDEANFAEPYKFKPERWLPGTEDTLEASQPFSLGTKGCLGRNSAMMEINLILAKMLWMYDLELMNQDLNWDESSRTYVMWWKPDLMVRFHKRKL